LSEECPVAIEGTAEEEEEAERQEWELSGAGEEAAKVPPPAAAAIAKKTQKKLNWGFGAAQKHNSQASTNVAAAAAREDYWRRTRTRDSIANTPLLCLPRSPDSLLASPHSHNLARGCGFKSPPSPALVYVTRHLCVRPRYPKC